MLAVVDDQQHAAVGERLSGALARPLRYGKVSGNGVGNGRRVRDGGQLSDPNAVRGVVLKFLRQTQSPVFQHLEGGGTRIGVLAERAQMTNQSMGYLVDALERRGYVERQPDPVDRRAALVVITDRGRDEIAAARRLIEQIESEWEQRIGSDLMAALWTALEAINRSRPGGSEPNGID